MAGLLPEPDSPSRKVHIAEILTNSEIGPFVAMIQKTASKSGRSWISLIVLWNQEVHRKCRALRRASFRFGIATTSNYVLENIPSRLGIHDSEFAQIILTTRMILAKCILPMCVQSFETSKCRRIGRLQYNTRRLSCDRHVRRPNLGLITSWPRIK